MDQLYSGSREESQKSEGWNISFMRTKLGFFSLEKRQLKVNPTVASQYIKGAYKAQSLFAKAYNNRRRSNHFKQKHCRFSLDLRKKLFMMRLESHRTKLPRKAVDVPSLEIFKVSLDGALIKLIL